MKALTLHQPWATMCFARRHPEHEAPVKWIETRSWPAPESVIGSRFAIHAGKKKPTREVFGNFDDGLMVVDAGVNDGYQLHDNGFGAVHPLPLGVLLGTVQLAACVPMVATRTGDPHLYVTDHQIVYYSAHGEVWAGEQRPYGWFEAGRWAWIFDNPRPFGRQLPVRGHQGLWTITADDD